MSKPTSFLISDLISNTSHSHPNTLMLNLKCMKNPFNENYQNNANLVNALTILNWNITASALSQQNKLDTISESSAINTNDNSSNKPNSKNVYFLPRSF